MSEELKTKIDTLQQLVQELRTKNEETQKGLYTKAEFQSFQDKITSDIQELQAKISRPPLETKEEKKDGPSLEMKAFGKLLRKGPNGLDAAEQKVLQISDATLGGYWAPGEFVNEIIKSLVLYSPIRTVAKVRSTSNDFLEIPKKTGASTAKWAAEISTRTETTGFATGLERITPHEMYNLYKITKKAAEDVVFNLEAEVQMDAAEQQGKLEGTAFVSGTGFDQPEGFLTNTEVLAGFSQGAGGSGVLGVTDIFLLYYALAARYANNAVWVMNRLSEKACMLLKDVNNYYIWMPSLIPSQPSTLLGRPILSCPDMPNIGSNAYALAIGDFQAGYTIVDRIQVEVQRLVELYAEAGQVGIMVRRRVGGQVVLVEAIKILKIQA